MVAAGLDIGTTTISSVVVDADSGEILDQMVIANNTFRYGKYQEARIQDPERIIYLAEAALGNLPARFPDICGVGLTGQMHGMLYVNRSGEAVSPLYTWQNPWGNLPFASGESYAKYLQTRVGEAAAGYGITTHFYLQKMGKIPEEAVKMVTISDYVAMRLCGNLSPVTAPDMAASFGCFDLIRKEFLTEKLEEAGVDTSYLPKICRPLETIGQTREGVPVIVPMGDNQASMIGSVKETDTTLLLNVGTGSQASMGTDRYLSCGGSVELRPCPPDGYLMVGSSLCGGRAYALLEEFYRSVPGVNEKSLYEPMLKQAEQYYDDYGIIGAWEVTPTFAGTRDKPNECGHAENIRDCNFHPGALTLGVIAGIIEELQGYYEKMVKLTGRRAKKLVGSGNGLRRNPLMKRVSEELFGMPMDIPKGWEDAAYGAALSALAGTGVVSSLKEAQQKIQYQ